MEEGDRMEASLSYRAGTRQAGEAARVANRLVFQEGHTKNHFITIEASMSSKNSSDG